MDRQIWVRVEVEVGEETETMETMAHCTVKKSTRLQAGGATVESEGGRCCHVPLKAPEALKPLKPLRGRVTNQAK